MSPTAPPLDEAVRGRIASLIGSTDVVLFMKGNRQAPQCGFSAQVVEILDSILPDYATFDVLSDGGVREGIKSYSSWPTIPQLYVRGEFLGGCDIVRELFASGELHDKLGVEARPAVPPRLEITGAAAEALRPNLARAEPGAELHLRIDARFQSQLGLGPPGPGEICVESAGVRVWMDALTAGRADGARIETVDTPQGPALRIDNPNAPRVQSMTAAELQRRLAAGEALELLDVRTPEERAQAAIPGATLLTPEEAQRLQGLPRDATLVFHCHHGGRSQAAAEHFAALGFTDVWNVEGGIDAWSRDVDPSVPRY